MIYIVREIQNAQSRRDGTVIEAGNLTGAKLLATRKQFFQRTVLTVEDQAGQVLATKTADGKWSKN